LTSFIEVVFHAVRGSAGAGSFLELISRGSSVLCTFLPDVVIMEATVIFDRFLFYLAGVLRYSSWCGSVKARSRRL